MGISKKRHIATGVTGALIGVIVQLSDSAAAQESERGLVLEEVIVTAQKREQSLQDTPIALTTFDSSAIEGYGIKNVSDIGLFTPNVNITKSPGGSAGATISVRGSATVNPAVTWEPTVGIYLDGVFLGKNIGGVFDIAELERVEVLRGPQGTLYGKNTVGGAINLITRKPGDEMGGKARLTAGNFDLFEGQVSVDTGAFGSVGQGLGQFRANFSYLKADRDGFYDNENIDPFAGFNPLVSSASTSEFSDQDDEVYRIDLVLAVTEDFEARYVYDYSDRDNKPTLGQLSNVSQAGFDAADAAGQAGGRTSALAPLLGAYASELGKRPDEVGNDNAGFERSETFGHALTLDYDAGNWGNFGDVHLKSITSLRELDYEDLIDIDGSTLDLFHSGRDIDYEQISQEFQLVGKTENTDYVVGLYYFSEEADVVNPISFFNFNGVGAPTDVNEYGMDNSSVAVFGQVDWHPIDRLTLTAGVRWTEEDREQNIFHPNTSGTGMRIDPVKADDDWDNVSLTFVAGWDLTEEINVYAKAAEGWKSGGFNGEAPTRDAFMQSYDPEEVLSLELGVKSRLLDNRLQVNAAVFHNSIEDMQFSVFQGGSAAISNVDNAGEATITGFELEAVGQLTESLRLTVAYGYLDTEYDEFIENGIDVKDQKDFQFSPRHTASVAADYVIGSWSWGVLDAHIDWSFKDEQNPYTSPAQNAVTKVDDYKIVNARLALSEVKVGKDNSLKFSLWGKNLTDEEYNTHGIPFGLWAVNYYGDPRTYGLDAIYEF